jgi:glyoxylase-like metal-dependent hydrolase (beta-lactamase superfamily II)
MKWIFLAIVAIVSSIGAAVADSSDSEVMRSYARARAVLDAGVAAMGGAEALTSLTSVTREFENHRTNPGQGPRPFDGAPTIDKFPIFSLTPTTSVIDYVGERLRFSQRFLSTSTKEWLTAIDAGGPAGGFSAIAYRDETPVYTANPAAVSRDFITRESRTYPEAILRAALRRPATLQWFGEAAIGGRRAQLISFVDADATRIVLSFDEQTRLLVRSEVLSEHPYLGQAIAASVYQDYRKTGRLLLPYRVEAWRNEEPLRIMFISKIELDSRADDATFAAPRERIDAPPIPNDPVLTSLGNDVYAVMGADNAMFAVFPEYVVLIESPRRESFAGQIFRLIESVAPGKPVKLVSTHFHEDHIGGVRYAAARGAEIWTTHHGKIAIERALRVRWTIRPDEFARAPRDVTINVIDKKQVFEAGKQRVEIAQVGPTEHTDQMLAVFFPNIGTLYTADVWDVPAPSVPTPGPDAARIVPRIAALGWKVQQMIPTHGVPASVADLNRSLEIRAKYMRGADTKHRLR